MTPSTDNPSDLEKQGWEWLGGMVSSLCDEEPSDIAYSADQMVDAFIAGASLRQASIAQQAEEEARLRRIVKGWADWYRLADGDLDCEYLNGKGWGDAEALADMSLAALRALNEQPGGEG